ncbi:PRD domain-containing protein [Enterococcus caccae]|uniref:PRD domain-containing protein n=1 Tax=Enterococcus caccae ATCC BAA-1240 TaxID=1158612 RepID=R3WMG2_9ENTE|nr:PRD domain-containing protein [Enterococcus caccae]EOL49026.1 hypothetical protein UC7_00871 [Enterococcus caccae ATCC BAA-1240]EOT65419.1 hypothetical protein I580_01175 [Enterococcus caccae ATCC BAA-1240]OJG25061.1 hypothetical protein RU98_GL001162 [Enterococcus caccae]
MYIKKRINNNVVLAVDGELEVIVVGKGLGFQVYPNDPVDPTLIQQVYLPTEKMNVKQMAVLLNEASYEEILLVEKIVKMGEEKLGREINPVILFSLLDHLLFAFKRHEEELKIRSPIEWEIKQFYPQEVEIGLQSIALIEEEKGIVLAESEAIFIAMHFVNYQFNQESMETTMDYMEAMADITQLVRYYFQVDLDETSINYHRFLNHLRYYLIRLNDQETVNSLDNEEIVLTVKKKYPKEFKCSLKISNYLEDRYKKQATIDEQLYLTLHLARLLHS